MKSLNTYINEGLADWSDDKLDKKISKQASKSGVKQEIIDWITNNTLYRVYKNKFKFDFSTTPITVNYDGYIKYKSTATSLTNDIFQWGEVKGYFDCSYCNSLKTLEGAPKKVGGDFDCAHCQSLITLKCTPKEIGGSFSCIYCISLKSLEGAPKEIGGHFNCSRCDSLKSLDGAPKEVGSFYCRNCGTQFTIYNVKKVSNVKKTIQC